MSYVRYVEELDLLNVSAEPTEYMTKNLAIVNYSGIATFGSVDYLFILIIILITIKFY